MGKLALGTVQFGLNYGITNHNGQVTIDEVKNILNCAKGNGINILDTASGYGDSEKVLGEIGVNNFQIITKTTPLQLGVDNILQSFHQSLADLNVASVDGLLIHNINDTKDKKFDSLYKELDKLKQDKLINKVGFSTYTPEQVDFLLNNFDFDLIQVPFNVFDTRLIDGGQLQALKHKNIEIHARSIFLQGVLLDFDNLSNYFSTWKGQFDEYRAIVKESGLSLLEYALNFGLNIEKIDKVLVGVNSEKQLREIASSIKKGVDLNAHPIYDVNLLNPSNWGNL
jgi:aryl-alcohol dehydrogenase-like predicted oxidoreductase